jgi:putative transposase
MPRRRRSCPAGYPVHIVQRGNNRQPCFGADAEMAAYANWLAESADRFGLAIHAWVFMTNHVHLLATPASDTAVSQSMQFLGRHYVRYFNSRHGRTGTLFEGRFRSSLVQTERYLLACQRYIELNPVRAGLVRDPSDYRWSSYHAHAFGRPARMWTPHSVYLGLGRTDSERARVYRQSFPNAMEAGPIRHIRLALNAGLACGDEHFRLEIELLTGQHQQPAKRGPMRASKRGTP